MRSNYLPSPQSASSSQGSSGYGSFNPLTALLAGLLPTPDYKAAYGQYSQSLNDLARRYDPYVEAGTGALAPYQKVATELAIDPTQSLNKIMGRFSESPYQSQMQQNLARMMNYNAAQTGMTGSTASQEQLQGALAGQENQFMQQYLQNAMGQQRTGMTSLSNLAQMGLTGLGGQSALGEQSAWEKALADIAPSKSSSHITNAIAALLGFS